LRSFAAVALAHHRAKSGMPAELSSKITPACDSVHNGYRNDLEVLWAGEEGGKPWDKLRWTQRLRLCEEINGASF